MIDGTYHFPRGFLWGTATAAHQVEGNNTNNQWAAWEQAGHTDGTSGLACDWWGGRWRGDFDRLADTGQKAHRLSVEWSRIQPTRDRWDEDALERYRAMLRGLHDRGVASMVTLHHFTDPLWLADQGGWESAEIVPTFERFVRKTVGALKEYCTLWCTINEPNLYALLGYAVGAWPPGRGGLRLALRVEANMARAHAAAYRTIHEIQPEARVGYALHYRPMVSRSRWSPLDALTRRIRYNGLNLGFPSAISTGVLRSPLGNFPVPEAKGTQDYLGLNYYSTDTVWFDVRAPRALFTGNGYPQDSDLSQHGHSANIPQGLYHSIQWAVRTYPHTPILITENGVESSDDAIRPRYLAQHLHQLWRAVNFNWPVKAYFHWTLVDNFEWERGWTQRFGLWALDVATQRRTKRPSADLYAAICKSNSLSSDMVRQYCPEVFDKIFPLRRTARDFEAFRGACADEGVARSTRSPDMRFSLLTPLVILPVVLAACGPSGRLALPAGFTVEEHALRGAPTLDPLLFDPVADSMDAIYARHAAARSQQFMDNSIWLNGHFSLHAVLGVDTLTATENYDSTGQHGWVTLSRNQKEIYRIDTGMASPITSLRGLWTYDGHWVLEAVYITPEQAVGKLSQDGQVLNDRYDYAEIFDFQLMRGRPFYFFGKDGKLGFSYDGHQIDARYAEIPHYECCSASVLNPRKAENMTSFFARRDDTWYYVEAGVFK